jgi:hypothetical protein
MFTPAHYADHGVLHAVQFDVRAEHVRPTAQRPRPRAARIAEVDVDAGLDAKRCMLRHLRALIPRKRASQLLWQGGDRLGNGVSHRLGAVAGQCGPVLLAGSTP